jgi:sec-independent protein translocase protein TatC
MFGIGFGATFWYSEYVITWLLVPAGGQLSPYDGGLPVFTAPQDMLAITIWLAVRGGLILAIPVLAIGAYSLAGPWLSSSQRRVLKVTFPVPLLLFLLGVAFAYYVMLPVGLGFLLSFGEGTATPLITIRQYLDLLWALMLAMGVVFQLPLAMYLLTRANIVTYVRFRSTRKFVPFTALIFGIILTPTDFISTFLVAVPVVVLYEVGLLLSRVAGPKVPKQVRSEARA